MTYIYGSDNPISRFPGNIYHGRIHKSPSAIPSKPGTIPKNPAIDNEKPTITRPLLIISGDLIKELEKAAGKEENEETNQTNQTNQNNQANQASDNKSQKPRIDMQKVREQLEKIIREVVIPKISEAITKFIQSLKDIIIKSVSATIKALAGPLGDVLSRAADTISNIADLIDSFLTNGASKIKKIVGNKLISSLDKIVSVVVEAAKILEDGKVKLHEVVQAVSSFGIEMVGGLIGSTIGGAIGSFIGGVAGGVTALVAGPVGAAVGSIIGSFVGEKFGDWMAPKIAQFFGEDRVLIDFTKAAPAGAK
ncbi:MAG: hypothetical protein ABDH21_01350 [bacterium]